MAKRTARQRNQLPPCYYEGFLEKRSFKDKTSRKLWTCLCGNALFFFNDKKDCDYVEKLDLSGMISITDDNSPDRNLEAARLNLQMKDGNIKFTVPSAEARELWKGFIHSVTELSVPCSLNLLPGQIHMLREAVEKERERITSVTPPAATNNPYVTLQADMPACYFSVSRMEAELLLEREAKRGNLLLRPGRGGNSFAVTTRQDHDGSIFRHYRVTRKYEGGFIIDVDNPVRCATLHDVINYLVDQTEGVLIPLIIEEPYEKNISFIRADNENGEKSVQQAQSNPVPPTLPPKPVERIIIPTPEPVPEEEECAYLNETMEENESEQTEESPAVPLPPPDKNTRKKAMMPPLPAPRKWASSASTASSTTSTNSCDIRLRTHSDSMGRTTLSELKLMLEKKAKSQE